MKKTNLRYYTWEHQPPTAVMNVPVMATQKRIELPGLAFMKAPIIIANAGSSIDNFWTVHAQLPTLAVL